MKIEVGFLETAEGSCWIECGKTKILCTASFSDKPPSWISEAHGWVTAEYGMLPKSSKNRIAREGARPRGRTAEIQRLIGRSVRAVTDLSALGERMVYLDCDVIQADGGTRTTAVTGALAAFWQACHLMVEAGALTRWPIREKVAAVSVGRCSGANLLDLSYEEDSLAEVDMNVVVTESGRFVEIQGTAEETPFDRGDLDALLDLALSGVKEVFARQNAALESMPVRDSSESR